MSNNKPISADVPQESIFGPLLFILSANDLFHFNLLGVKVYVYADDTAIMLSAANNESLQITVNNNFFNKIASDVMILAWWLT